MAYAPRHNQRCTHLTPAQKLQLAAQLYKTAWGLKRAGLKMLHPDWPETQITQELKRIFRYART